MRAACRRETKEVRGALPADKQGRRESHALCYPPASTPQCIQLGAQGTECWPVLRARGPAQLHELMNLRGREETTGSYVQLLFTVLKCKFTSIPPLLQSLPCLPTELRTKSHPLPCLPPSPGLLFPAAASAPISLFKCTKLIPTSGPLCLLCPPPRMPSPGFPQGWAPPPPLSGSPPLRSPPGPITHPHVPLFLSFRTPITTRMFLLASAGYQEDRVASVLSSAGSPAPQHKAQHTVSTQ